MAEPDSGLFVPKWPRGVAAAVFVLAALTLCWPILGGEFLVGPNSDQLHAGYSFRHFAAEYFRTFGQLPLWNPYLFGGLPFVGAAHGDIFYPTAWLRLVTPTDLAMSLGFAIHLVIAGLAMYGLLRALRLPWAAAVIGGLGYELSGMVASQVHPGHDGKLFVSAMAPLLFLGVLLAVRDRRIIGYALIALTTGLALQGHPQTSAYLIIAAAVWGLLLVFGWDEGPRGRERWKTIGFALGAVSLGIGLYAVYALPMLEYVPFSPRSDAGESSGWQYMTAFSMPPEELVATILPQFDGMVRPTYFGRNGLKLHGEYLGPVILLLALVGLGGKERRRERLALGVVGVLFLLVALGRHTPFYRLWYEVVPMMQKVRAPGMAFYLPSMVLSVLAGFGAERLLRGAAASRRILIGAGVIGLIALLGSIGALQAMAEDLGRSAGFPERAIANAEALQMGAARLLAFTLVGGGLMFAIARRRVTGSAAVFGLAVVLLADLWSVDRKYFAFSPPARELFAPDSVMQRMEQAPLPYRVWAPEGRYGQANPYIGSWLMAAGVPTLFGYHGNELRFFDDLFGGKNDWPNQVSPALHRLYGVRFAVFNQPVELPGYRQILGPVPTAVGQPAYLFEADTVPPYARVVRGAAKLPDDQLVATINDPRFPIDRIVLYADTAAVTPASLGSEPPEPSNIMASITDWRPGRIEVALTGRDPAPTYFLVAENWYPGWTATVDDEPTAVLRADNALLSVVLPPGAERVVLEFRSAAYRRGRAISIVSLAGVLGLFALAAFRRRTRNVASAAA